MSKLLHNLSVLPSLNNTNSNKKEGKTKDPKKEAFLTEIKNLFGDLGLQNHLKSNYSTGLQQKKDELCNI
jgi:hypothetical protein